MICHKQNMISPGVTEVAEEFHFVQILRSRRKALPWESPFPLQELKLVKLLCFHCCIQTDCMMGSADIVEWIGSHKESKLRIEHFAETNGPRTFLTNSVM